MSGEATPAPQSPAQKFHVKQQIAALYRRSIAGVGQASMSVIAALLAYTPAHWLGLQDGFWASITAIAVTQGEFHSTADLGRRQCIGALVGGSIGFCFALCFGHATWVYAAAVLTSISICTTINRSDSGQLAGITATIVLLVPHTGSPESIVISRLSEVALGACSGAVVVWVYRPLKEAVGRAVRRTWSRLPTTRW
jgi:uncharacterized membrane protein YgaE (UPF0421/DUF939 family)